MGLRPLVFPIELLASPLAKKLNDRALRVCLDSRMLASFDAYMEYFNRLYVGPKENFCAAELYLNRLDSHLIENYSFGNIFYNGFDYKSNPFAIDLKLTGVLNGEMKKLLQSNLSAVLNHKEENVRKLKHLYFLMNGSPSFSSSEKQLASSRLTIMVHEASPINPEKVIFSCPSRILINTGLQDLTAGKIFLLIQDEAKFTYPSGDIFNETVRLFLDSFSQIVDKPFVDISQI